MKSVVGKSLGLVVLAVAIMYVARVLLHTDQYLSDVSGLSAFVTVFGTLYGIMAAFVVIEVWGQFNRTSELIEEEGQGLERLFRLTLYFRDKKLEKKMATAIKKYAQGVIGGKFQTLAGGQHNVVNGKNFRAISEVIRDIKFDDDHDPVVFDHIVDHFGALSKIRTDRINQSLTRLPVLLKLFLYTTSSFALLVFVFMPFALVWYAALTVGFLAFVLAMTVQIIEDLDNPFVGNWHITPEPFERAIKHIEEDY